MDLNPINLYEKFCNTEIDKTSLIKSLSVLIEDSNDDTIRIQAINILKKLGIKTTYIFKIMESLLLSDTNEKIRNNAATYIGALFIEKSYNVIKWAIQHETSYECVITLINTLRKIQNNDSKELLISEISKIKKLNKSIAYKQHIFKKYKKGLKKVFKMKNIEEFSINELAEIFINYKTVINLANMFPNFYFELDTENGLVSELDLADYLQYEVKGTPWGWKNNIKTLTEIRGLGNLKYIKKIDLSNNLIEYIDGLLELKNLKTIILANNKIYDLENLKYLKSLSNLRYIDLSGNEISKKLSEIDFKPNIKVILETFHEHFE